MSPSPQEHATPRDSVPPGALHGDSIVVSGMAGLLPGCHNIEEFSEKLYNKVNLVKETPTRWGFRHPELPSFVGHVPKLDRFDAQFFMVNQRLANVTDVQSRKVLELAYEAIFDAGVSPLELNGKRVGVFIAVTTCETEKIISCATGSDGIAGCNRAMFANRISFYLNTVGPSVTIDCNGCGGMVALERAQHALRSGICDAAIVGGSKVMLHPQSALHHGRLVSMNRDGVTRAYDKNGDGHAVSEAISVLFLQKHKDARRVYANLCHVKTQYNKLVRQKELEYGFIREPESYEMFLREFYKEAGVPTSCVDYVEGIGAGIPETDTAELQVLEKVFTKGRNTPVLVGSVTSNMGYAEAASGFVSMVKVLLAQHKGSIAPNLHYKDPLDVSGVKNGKLSIVAEEEKFGRTYTAVNNNAFTGVYGHALLKGHFIPKDANKYDCNIPYLLNISGRHEGAVKKVFDWVKAHPVDYEELSLLNTFHKSAISSHMARGFIVLSKVPNENPKVLKQEVDFFDDVHRPLCFVYSGMGSQWVGMGEKLMRIPVFAEAIHKCDKVLSPKGVNIIDIITSPNESTFDNILHAFVGIAAVQIGITDVLKTVGIAPDLIIGHSVGELGCAYADGCVTAEEMIALSYYRGRVSLDTPVVRGAMAAVGLGFKQVTKLLPPEIEVACHNSATSSTISGPADVMEQFVGKLVSQGIFAKEVACSNIAYHSRYIADAGPALLKYCKTVVKTPKLRSERWLPTSVPQERWAEDAKYSSAEYHVNNLLSPVLFEETSQLIPQNAVLVEIAPHSLLQAILLRSMPKSCDYISLTRRGHADSTTFLLEAIGRLYKKGYDVDISHLYPKIQYPVSTETRSLSHLVEWDHSEIRRLCTYQRAVRHQTAIFKQIVTLHEDEYKFMKGYCVEDKIVLPYAAVLVYVWDTLAMSINKQKENVSARFQNVRFSSQPILSEQSSLYLTVQLQRGSGRFEVTFEHGVIADGFISNETHSYGDCTPGQEEPMSLNSEVMYCLLREKGYQLRDEFQIIEKSDKSLHHAQLKWRSNWVTLLDGMLQLLILQTENDGLSKLEHIHQMTINVQKQEEDEAISSFQCYHYSLPNLTKCGPIIMEKVSFKNVPYKNQQKPLVRCQKFVPFINHSDYDENTNLAVLFQIVRENINESSLKVLEINGCNAKNLEHKNDLLHLKKVVCAENDVKTLNEKYLKTVTTVILNKIDSEKMVFENLGKYLLQNTFIINITRKSEKPYRSALYKPVASMGTTNRLELAIWRQAMPSSTKTITVKSPLDFSLVQNTLASLPSTHKLLVLTTNPAPSGFKDLINNLKSMNGRNQIFAALLDEFNPKLLIECHTIVNLVFNTLKQGKWGGEYFVPESKNELKTISNVVLQTLKPGDLDSVSWVETKSDSSFGIPIKVHFAGLNVFDAKRATAEVTPAHSDGYGMDFSGTTERGVRVMGIIKGGAASKEVRADPELLWPVPSHWSMEEAATIPLPYCLAFYCLCVRVRLRRRHSVLVEGGAGALGQAALAIALATRCRVFATVSDMHKKRFLKRLFPDLPLDHIGNSRDDSFMEMVMFKTNGEGCDIVISSAKGELKRNIESHNVEIRCDDERSEEEQLVRCRAYVRERWCRNSQRISSLQCCAAMGTTIDLIQIHAREHFDYGMYNMTKERSYTPIDFASLFNGNNQHILKNLQLLVSSGIARGFVRPLSRVSYPARAAPRALRLLAASRHRGRVLLDMRAQQTEAAVPQIPLSSNNYQLVFCDESALSHQLVDTLINQGARNIMLHASKSSTIMDFKTESWRKLGVKIYLFISKINKNEVIEFVTQGKLMGSVDGIYIVSLQTDPSIQKIITDIDDASRELALPLMHFCVITQDHQLGCDTHSRRIVNGLPSTRIQLNNLEKVEDHLENGKIALKHKTAMEAVVSTLCHGSDSVQVYTESLPQTGVIDYITKIPERKLAESYDEDANLEDIGIDENNSQLICNIAEEKFGICLKTSDVHKMTIKQIKALEVNSLKSTEVQGLDGSYGFIDPDEVRANCEFLTMNTLVQNSNKQLEEFDMDASYLCVVPGLEGHHGRFSSLCERLKIGAMVLQPGFDRPNENLDQIAERLVQVMNHRIKSKKDFYLLGYEFSVPVVLKMARILENAGMTGTVYCLGGTPEQVRTTLLTQINCRSEEDLQDAIIQHIYRKFNGSRLEQMLDKVKAASNWQEKIDICTTMLRSQVKQSNQYFRDIIESLYSKILLLHQHEAVEGIYSSKIVFLCGKAEKKIPEYALKNIYGKDTVIHEIDAPLAQLPKDLNVSNIINKYLAKEILDAYKVGNRCEAVLMKNDVDIFTCEF